MQTEDRQIYPVGKFQYTGNTGMDDIEDAIKDIAVLPSWLNEVTSGLSADDLMKTYRPGSWTVKQIVHHLADSHLNAYIRFRLALTEETPTVKPYIHNAWAELPDAKSNNINSSLSILDGLHERWETLLESLSPEDYDKAYYHPEQKRNITLGETVCLYGWHGKHHLGQIQNALAK